MRRALLNPANERLVGTLFTPSEANARLLGEGLIYPCQSVDGLVAEFGGSELARACQALPVTEPGTGERCPVGEAVLTPAFGELVASFDILIHTVARIPINPLLPSNALSAKAQLPVSPPAVPTLSHDPARTTRERKPLPSSIAGVAMSCTLTQPPRSAGDALRPQLCFPSSAFLTRKRAFLQTQAAPFWGDAKWPLQLGSCYDAALSLALQHGVGSLAAPLLGAGARGAPPSEAARVAASAVAAWMGRDATSSLKRATAPKRSLPLLFFAVPDEHNARALSAALGSEMDSITVSSSEDG